MHPPPSPALCLRYPITTCIAVLAIAATFQSSGGVHIDPAFLSNAGDCLHEPWRLLTPALFHGGYIHLIFNLCWLWAFGTLIEDQLGHGPTLGIYSFLAAGSMAAELALFRGGIGLSGVVYGLFGMLWVLSRTDPRFRNAVDRGVIELMCGWFLLCIVLTIADVFRVANVAHGVGCLLGVLLGWTIGARAPGLRLRRGAVLATVFLLCIAGGTVARPYVNLSNDNGPALAEKGRSALALGDAEQAIDYYERAVAANGSVDDWWTGLGLAYQQAGRNDDAGRAFEHANQLKRHRFDSE